MQHSRDVRRTFSRQLVVVAIPERVQRLIVCVPFDQHATRDRDVAIAAALSDLLEGSVSPSRPAVVSLLRREPDGGHGETVARS